MKSLDQCHSWMSLVCFEQSFVCLWYSCEFGFWPAYCVRKSFNLLINVIWDYLATSHLAKMLRMLTNVEHKVNSNSNNKSSDSSNLLHLFKTLYWRAYRNSLCANVFRDICSFFFTKRSSRIQYNYILP